MDTGMSKVYVLPDASGRITRIDGGYTMPEDLTGWVLIDEGTGDRYNLCQGNYLPGPLTDDRGIYRYKAYQFVDAPAGKIIARFFKNDEEYVILERTQEEMDADYVPPEIKPTDAERISELEAKLAAYEAAYEEGVNEA